MEILEHSIGGNICKALILVSILICFPGCNQSYKEDKSVTNETGLTYMSQLANYNNGNFVTEYQGKVYFLSNEASPNLYVMDAPFSSLASLDEPNQIATNVKAFFVSSSGVLYTHNDDSGLFLITEDGTNTIYEGSCKQINLFGDLIYFTDENSNIYKTSAKCSDIELLYENVTDSTIDNIQPTVEGLYFRLWSPGTNTVMFYNFATGRCGQVSNIDAERYYVIDSHIYFIDAISSDLWKMALESDSKMRLTSSHSVMKDSLVLHGDWLIYSDIAINGGTKAYNILTHEQKDISHDSYQFIFVTGTELITNEDIISLPR